MCIRQTIPRLIPRPIPRHGVAMLLVLISLMTASVLTVAYVASRDNSGIIGENVASAAAARWAADSGLDMGVAMLETRTDWRNEHTFGKYIDDYSLAGSMIDIDLLDLETGLPPTSLTEYVRITARAVTNGVEQTSTGIANVPTTSAASVDLSEFAIFGKEGIELQNDAIVTRWTTAALSQLGQPIALGTQAQSVGAIGIYNCATAIDSEVYCGPSASNSLISTDNGADATVTKLMDTVPLPAPPHYNVPDPNLLDLVLPVVNLLGSTGLITTDNRYSNITIGGNSTRTYKGNITITSVNDLTIQNSKVLIDGNVKIVVFDALVMQNAAIELLPGARLTMHIGGNVTLNDSYIGDRRSTNVRDNTGAASYTRAKRIMMFDMAGSGAPLWTFGANSVVKGSVFAPKTSFTLRNQSALYGRVAARLVTLLDAAALFYDPSLNRRNGYINQQSALHQADKQLYPAVRTLGSLNPSNLQSLADTYQIKLISVADENVEIVPAGYSETAPAATPVTEPTPRPIDVSHHMISFGSSVAEWEYDIQ